MTKEKNIHIGTSGWHYKHWEGPFYPENISTDKYLEYYSKFFHTVEINNTFYKMPEKKTIKTWRETVPGNFIFSVKASRYITHMKKLKDAKAPVSGFIKAVKSFKGKLGPILFQLPPNWHINPERLNSFIRVLPRGYRYAFEFRHPSWFDPEIYGILEKHNKAFCMYEIGGQTSPKITTADFVYIRLHGPEGPYQGQYKTDVLAEWADAFSAWTKLGKEVFCYFDNDEAGYAPQDAMNLQDMVKD